MSDHSIFVIEPLLGFPGHFFRQLVNLAGLLPHVQIMAFGHQRVTTANYKNLQVRPLFAAHIFDQPGTLLKPDAFYMDRHVQTVLDQCTPRDHLLVPSADIDILSALVRCLANRDLKSAPMVHLRFYALEMAIVSPEKETADLMATLFSYPGAWSRIRICTELPEMADHVEKTWGMPADWFPYLHPSIFSKDEPRLIDLSEKVRIGFCGHGKFEKGRQWIPPIIESFRNRAPGLADRVCWVIQSSGDYASAKASLQPVLDFDGANPGLIELHTDILTDDAYNELFNSMDMVGLPYVPDRYRLRGSGVAVEATYCGKPFVYSKATPLGSLAGGSAIACGSVFGFADAFAEIVANYPKFQSEALRARAKLLNNITNSSMLRRLSVSA